MLLALDVGNSHIFGGVFEGENLRLKFRKSSRADVSSDEIGVFLKGVLRENGLDAGKISGIAVCSVVPELSYSLRSACAKYFPVEPFFLQAGVKTGLNIKYKNPAEVGADRIANAVGAVQLYPGRNIIIVDFGTATTFCAVTKNRDYLGGLIMPGPKTAMESLASRTALLRAVEIVRPSSVVGKTTAESIQAGIYYSNMAAVREIHSLICREDFAGEDAVLVGTGGFCRLFEQDKLFDAVLPDLVLSGLKAAHAMNQKNAAATRSK